MFFYSLSHWSLAQPASELSASAAGRYCTGHSRDSWTFTCLHPTWGCWTKLQIKCAQASPPCGSGMVIDGSGCSCGCQQKLLSVMGMIQEDEEWSWGCSLWLMGSVCGMGRQELRYVFAGCSGSYNGEQFHCYQIELDAAACSKQSNLRHVWSSSLTSLRYIGSDLLFPTSKAVMSSRTL